MSPLFFCKHRHEDIRILYTDYCKDSSRYPEFFNKHDKMENGLLSNYKVVKPAHNRRYKCGENSCSLWVFCYKLNTSMCDELKKEAD